MQIVSELSTVSSSENVKCWSHNLQKGWGGGHRSTTVDSTRQPAPPPLSDFAPPLLINMTVAMPGKTSINVLHAHLRVQMYVQRHLHMHAIT